MSCMVAAGLAATRMALGGLSGGTVRKLETNHRSLAEHLERWLSRRDELRILIRLLLALNFLFLLICLIAWQDHCALNQTSWGSRLLPPVLGTAFFLITSEWLGHHLSSLTTARFLACTIPTVRALGILLFPLTAPLYLWHRRGQSRRRASVEDGVVATAEDEIMSLVEQDAQDENPDAALEADERRMIRGIFDLDETLVHEIMTPRVDVGAVEDNATPSEVKARIVSTGHSRIPVFHGTIDRIVGVVYAKDLLDDAKLQNSTALSDFYHRPVFIPETKNVGDLLNEFQQNRNHFAVVLDEYGGTAGIVTFEDILEEIVGEIRDEYDADEPLPTRQRMPDGSLTVDARITIDELNDALDVEIPEDEDFDTLGGYISTEAGRIPQAGETLETDLLVLEIVSADPRRVLQAKVRKRPMDETVEDDAL